MVHVEDDSIFNSYRDWTPVYTHSRWSMAILDTAPTVDLDCIASQESGLLRCQECTSVCNVSWCSALYINSQWMGPRACGIEWGWGNVPFQAGQ